MSTLSTSERIINKSKNGDYHLGKLIWDCFSSRPKDDITQIDAWTGKTETYGSQWVRSARLAHCLRALGLKPGDVLAVGGRNHLDIYVPFYAAMYNGLPIVGVDPYYKYDEIKKLFKTTQPKIAFCQQETKDTYEEVARDLGLDLRVVTFDEGEHSLDELLEQCEDEDIIQNFRCSDFDLDSVYAWLVTTSGTTGSLKAAAFKHTSLVSEFVVYLQMKAPDESPKLGLNISPVQWISSFISAVAMPMMNSIKLMSSGPDTVDHVIDIINQYRPVSLTASPSMLSLILKSDKDCDLNCFYGLQLTGSKVHRELVTNLKSRINPKGVVLEMYGQTESIGAVLLPTPHAPAGSCGMAWQRRQLKLVDPNTHEEIREANIPGELWIKGPCFTEYYNDPIATSEAFSEDGWYKSGDLLYRDDNNFYYYVDRLKTLIKYQGNTITPTELEEVIMSIHGVQEVAVTSVPHPEDCERAVACVVRCAGAEVTAEQVKEAVASKFSPKKQLHGGVLFLSELPKTSTGKVLRLKLKEIALNALKL